eukprot:scaffold128621_cov20-Prasinocladus_malaysianus.AAC.3
MPHQWRHLNINDANSTPKLTLANFINGQCVDIIRQFLYENPGLVLFTCTSAAECTIPTDCQHICIDEISATYHAHLKA